ncbi:MAG TPA: hypothetical protein VMW76_04395 [Bacteroidales bacterium]|nr:hypothetical protein [Bacteroidales bacterium]
MKKVHKVLVYSIAIIIVGADLFSCIAYSSFSSLKGIEVNEPDLACFPDSYDDCRSTFLIKAQEMTDSFENTRKETYLRMYNPDAEVRRSIVISQSREVLTTSLVTFSKLPD